MRQDYIMCLLIQLTEEYIIIFLAFLPKIHRLNLLMRK